MPVAPLFWIDGYDADVEASEAALLVSLEPADIESGTVEVFDATGAVLELVHGRLVRSPGSPPPEYFAHRMSACLIAMGLHPPNREPWEAFMEAAARALTGWHDHRRRRFFGR
jgi:hypothetical protein